MTESMPAGPSVPLIEAKAIWKFFGGIPVLKGIDLTLQPGQVHALLGGNGAGKSTLMKIIAGLYRVDRGELFVRGAAMNHLSPVTSSELGIYLVPQEPLLFPSLSVEENVLMHVPGNRKELRTRLLRLIQEVGASLQLSTLAGQLEVADQQMVEILRGLIRQARILILDEPTSALTPREVGKLFERIRALTAQGVGIFFISHKLGEIRTIADTVSILRDGKIVLAGPPRSYSDAEIVHAMTQVEGKSAFEVDGVRPPPNLGREVLRVERLCGEGFADISFSLRAGEVLGLAGVVGSGRTELAETVYGIRPLARGHIFVDGEAVATSSPRHSLDHGIVYLPENRQLSGLFIDAPLVWNASSLVLYREPAWLDLAAETERFRRQIDLLGIVCSSPSQSLHTLSGGNQQKILLAKCLAAEPKVLILDEPTRGVDVAVRADIYRLIDTLAADGLAILLISSDHEEVQRLCHRVLVMDHGTTGGMLEGAAITVGSIARLAFGLTAARETAR
ncbi:MAG: autoinducer 2 ABC transporter ATP-binding protein LsrA [Ancalomicrobiaceae bacterium]|nr:autoinducer 2 ABC transporter ATP-binding protein LsrA [Ancalomicrobiaceae bacterium]